MQPVVVFESMGLERTVVATVDEIAVGVDFERRWYSAAARMAPEAFGAQFLLGVDPADDFAWAAVVAVAAAEDEATVAFGLALEKAAAPAVVEVEFGAANVGVAVSASVVVTVLATGLAAADASVAGPVEIANETEAVLVLLLVPAFATAAFAIADSFGTEGLVADLLSFQWSLPIVAT
jgi:hypothetical protein